jgi:hypothetical protein
MNNAYLGTITLKLYVHCNGCCKDEALEELKERATDMKIALNNKFDLDDFDSEVEIEGEV